MLVRVPLGYHAGGWKIFERIASGSWASVYAARRVQRPRSPQDPPRDTVAALKVLPGGTLSPPQFADLQGAIAEEVRFSEQADHPRLIRTFETFVVDDPGDPELHGAVVLAMERAERSVQDLLATVQRRDAERIVREICEGLVHMHAAGWVHGDLKPSNVLLMADGSVRLADFGLARELDGTHAYAPRLGSSDYLPPEWWSERVSAQGIAIRPTADVWALGVTAHQLLTGGLLPFAGATARARGAAAQAYAGGHAELRLADELPAQWHPIVADCLAPDHASRLEHSAASLLARIEQVADDGEGAPARGAGAAARGARGAGGAARGAGAAARGAGAAARGAGAAARGAGAAARGAGAAARGAGAAARGAGAAARGAGAAARGAGAAARGDGIAARGEGAAGAWRALLRRRPARIGAALVALAAASGGAVVAASGDDPAPRGAMLKVYNAEAACRHSLRADCRLGLAGDPHVKYAPANIVGHARHGDGLTAECWIADGTPVMAEDRRTSTRWYRVRTTSETAWLPAVRAWPGVTPAVAHCKS